MTLLIFVCLLVILAFLPKLIGEKMLGAGGMDDWGFGFMVIIFTILMLITAGILLYLIWQIAVLINNWWFNYG